MPVQDTQLYNVIFIIYYLIFITFFNVNFICVS